MYEELYNGPITCCSNTPVSIVYNNSTGYLQAKCPIITSKLVTVKRQPVMLETGNEKCDFHYEQKIHNINNEFNYNILNSNFSSMCLKSDTEIIIDSIINLDDNSIDRNQLLYYYYKYVQENKNNDIMGTGIMKKNVMNRVKKIDDYIIKKFKQFINNFIIEPSYDKIGEIIWLYNKYIDPKKKFKIDTALNIKEFMQYILSESKRLEKDGFPYIKPKYIKKIININDDNKEEEPKKETIKKVVKEEEDKIDIFKKLLPPSEMHKRKVININVEDDTVEFSDDEDEDDEDVFNEDDIEFSDSNEDNEKENDDEENEEDNGELYDGADNSDDEECLIDEEIEGGEDFIEDDDDIQDDNDDDEQYFSD